MHWNSGPLPVLLPSLLACNPVAPVYSPEESCQIPEIDRWFRSYMNLRQSRAPLIGFGFQSIVDILLTVDTERLILVTYETGSSNPGQSHWLKNLLRDKLR